MDATNQVLVAALKEALAQPGEQRLFRSGKLHGIFASRTGANGESAAQALRDGLLEVVRSETKGKTTTEWVRVTPKAVEFVQGHESPLQALQDLQAVLQMTQQGIPVWVGQLRQEIQQIGDRLADQVQLIAHRIDALSQRVAEAVGRAEDAAKPRLPDDVAAAIPWAHAALTYLGKRNARATPNQCTLPELYAALRAAQPDLTVADYHAGLRRLQECAALRLLPHEGQEALAEPEYALLDGATTFYHVVR